VTILRRIKPWLDEVPWVLLTFALAAGLLFVAEHLRILWVW
jgi:hypothetical protein